MPDRAKLLSSPNNYNEDYKRSMDEDKTNYKRPKKVPSPDQIKSYIYKNDEPIVLKNVLSWNMLRWTAEDWVEKLGDEKLDLRIGTSKCTMLPQWESNCKTVAATISEVFDKDRHESDGTWIYFDYKHLNHHLRNKTDLLECVSWADFGFPDKDGKDSTIWIGTKGAHTPCHMDSYGCNIVAQVYGRKLWVMFPPSKTSLLRPVRVPYEESSVYSNINFSCGRNVNLDMGGARVVELTPGDVLVVPKHWWHYVENLTSAISINMWIPLESDDASRLEESLVRFFVSSMLKATNVEGESQLLNPNEVELINEPVDLRQISWCLDQVVRTAQNSCSPSPTPDLSCLLSAVPTFSADHLQNLLLEKCGCVKDCEDKKDERRKSQELTMDHVINAFCHPDIIKRVSQLLVSSTIT